MPNQIVHPHDEWIKGDVVYIRMEYYLKAKKNEICH